MPIRIIDDDRDEIRAEVNGQLIRSWEYHSEQERRVKMLAAREFAEGWYQAVKAVQDAVDSNAGDGLDAVPERMQATLTLTGPFADPLRSIIDPLLDGLNEAAGDHGYKLSIVQPDGEDCE